MKTKKTQNRKVVAVKQLVSELSKAYEDSLNRIFKNFNIEGGMTTKRAYNKKSAKAPQPAMIAKPISRYQIFLDVLKNIGRPAMTREIASRVKKVHPEVKVSKATLIKQLYNSASYLAKEGVITRTPVGKRMYEYSIKNLETAAA